MRISDWSSDVCSSDLRHRAPVTSRAAENMYWLGRYTERAENAVRLARLTLDLLSGEDPSSPALLTWLHDMAWRNALVQRDVPRLSTGARRVGKECVRKCRPRWSR